MGNLFSSSYGCGQCGEAQPPNSGKGKNRKGSIKYGFNLVEGKSDHPLEDFHVAKFVKVGKHEVGLFGIFDGHLDERVAAYLQKHLFSNILNEDEFWRDPSGSIIRAYEKTDQSILSNSSELGRGGSTAVTAILINGKKLWVANVGDSRAILCRKGEAVAMTTDHDPNDDRDLIETKGGYVSYMPGDVPRVDGQLAVCRAFGDKTLKPHIRSDPDIQDATLDSDDDVLVLASDGVWKVMENQEAVDIARSIADPHEAAKQVATRCVDRDAKDDISCIVVRLRG